MSKHAWITALISLLITVILFGIGAVTILAVRLGPETQLLLPVVVLVSILLAPLAAEHLSPRLTRDEHEHHDDEEVNSGRTYPRGG